MDDLKTAQDLVMDILTTTPKARNSDNYLLYVVYARVGKMHGIDINQMSVPTFFLHLKEYGFPSPETIRRTRQKIQAAYPELAASDKVESFRYIQEEAFKKYAKGAI